MLFERFRKKRQATADAELASATNRRRQALTECALRHTDPAQRRQAIAELDDFSVLEQVLAAESDVAAREAAVTRAVELLLRSPASGEHTAEIGTDATLALIARLDAPVLLERLALDAGRPEARHAAIARTNSQSVLARCAVEDARAANRAAALARLADKAALEQVIRQIGKRDKTVYRQAREKLRAIAEQEARPQRVRAQGVELCEKAEQLGRLANWRQDQALLTHLERQWAELAAEVPDELTSRFDAARAHFLAAFEDAQAEQAAHAAREAEQCLLATRQSLVEQLEQAVAEQSDDRASALSAGCAEAWARLPDASSAEHEALTARYRALMAVLAERSSAEVASDQPLAAADEQPAVAEPTLAKPAADPAMIDRLQQQVTDLLGQSRPLDLRHARRQLEALRAALVPLADAEGCGAGEALAARLDERLRRQQLHAEQRLDGFEERLGELERLAEVGELKQAESLDHSLRAALELIRASNLRDTRLGEFASRMRAVGKTLSDLRQWRRWGGDQHREALCAEIETLATREIPLETLALELHRLREGWQALDRTGSRADPALWERFRQSAEALHERVRPLVVAQTAARERICHELEEFLARIDWERVDWKQLARAERDTRQAWSALPQFTGARARRLHGRYHQAMRQLRQHLDDERARNQKYRQGLIERVRALLELDDLDRAIQQTKALQRDWQITAPGRQRDENRLWREFRAACDQVFERREARDEVRLSERRAHLAAREQLLEQAAHFLAGQPQQLAAQWSAWEQRWQDLHGQPLPRAAARELDQRWQALCREARAQRRATVAAERQAGLDLLSRQAEICAALERRVLGLADAGCDADATQLQWERLPSLDDADLQQRMCVRFGQASALARGEGQLESLRARRAEDQAELGRLCLRLEIAVGIDSPPELAQERLELQVARLAERMADGSGNAHDGAIDTLLQEWFARGPADSSETGLQARFARIRKTLLEGACVNDPASDSSGDPGSDSA